MKLSRWNEKAVIFNQREQWCQKPLFLSLLSKLGQLEQVCLCVCVCVCVCVLFLFSFLAAQQHMKFLGTGI